MMRILVVEDEYLLAMDLKRDLQRLDAEVVGPVGQEEQAMRLATAEPLDGALLDINLQDGTTFAVAELLQSRGVPFAFITGYQQKELPAALKGARRLVKPVQRKQLKELIFSFAEKAPG